MLQHFSLKTASLATNQSLVTSSQGTLYMKQYNFPVVLYGCKTCLLREEL